VGKSEAEINTWVKAQECVFEAEFGDNLKLGVVQMEEASPHLHLGGILGFLKRRGRVKESSALNARRWDPADPAFFWGLPDSYAAHNVKFGLERGKSAARRREDVKGSRVVDVGVI
jgi:hypothetical protein